MRIDRLAPPAKAQPIRPYKQGELDGLCGLYAIINSIRWCLRGHALSSKGQHWCDVFAVLNNYAVKELVNLSIASTGTGLNSMIWLLRTAQEHMIDVHGVHIRTHRPFALSKPKQSVQITETILNHLNHPNSSALLAIYGAVNHWTVTTEITNNTVKLFDSDRSQTMSATTLQPADLVSKKQRRSHIQPGSLICLSLVEKCALE